jgi:tetratricopeptide (TPR) repeat protein
VEAKTANLSLDSISYVDLRNMTLLSYDWDTLGWVYYRLGRDAEAEKYLRAAWNLSESPDLAKHVGRLYQKEGKVRLAERFYALALAAPHTTPVSPIPGPQPNMSQSTMLNVDAMPKTRRRLQQLLRSESRAFQAVQRARRELDTVRTVRLPKLASQSRMAEFYVLFGTGPKVEAVKFLSGAEELRGATKDLAAARFDVRFPDAGKEKIVRKGVLDCEPEVSYCQFIMMTPDAVQPGP